jgi:meiotically up-regulated gene 157 (Mug157) protein
MQRRKFVQNTAMLSGGLMLAKIPSLAKVDTLLPMVRVPTDQRKFSSKVIEGTIAEFQTSVKDKELAWLFGNCFPNTQDTTVTYQNINAKPDTYVITGDIDAMWLRDSSAQVWPYLSFINQDKELQQVIARVISRQAVCLLRDPYANAFYDDANKTGEWKNDQTDMKPGLHERKWEVDSLCYPIRLAHRYWKLTGDTQPFDAQWQQAVKLTLKTFKGQQRKHDDGPNQFQRKTAWATDGAPMNGYGYPVKPAGLICSAFRPSDDATVFIFDPFKFFCGSKPGTGGGKEQCSKL